MNTTANCEPADLDLALLLESLADVCRRPVPEAPSKARPIFSWQGGKRWLVKELLPLIPQHKMYVELFCGGGALLCAKPTSEGEVINDINSDLVSLYRVVKYHPDELFRELDFCLNSREDFAAFKEQRGLTDIQRAARWFMRMKNGFGGSPEHFGRARTGGGAAFSSREGKLGLMKAMHRRFDKVVIENLDWRKCIDLYDSKNAVFFCDPPYTTGAAHYGAWSFDDLASFRETGLDQMKGTWILTIDDTPGNRGLFRDCHIRAFQRSNGISRGKNGVSTYHELIIRPKDGRHRK